jgi:hypothetical protein
MMALDKIADYEIRKQMRNLDVGCPHCGCKAFEVVKEKDTPVGIMDDICCCDCDKSMTMISSVQTFFVTN